MPIAATTHIATSARSAAADAKHRLVLSVNPKPRTWVTTVQTCHQRRGDVPQRVRAPGSRASTLLVVRGGSVWALSSSTAGGASASREAPATGEAPSTWQASPSQQAGRRGARAGRRGNRLGKIGQDDLGLAGQTRFDLGVLGTDHADLHRHTLLLACLDDIDVGAAPGRMHGGGRYHRRILRLGQGHDDPRRRAGIDPM